MYKSDAYWDLERRIGHWQAVQRQIDLARMFRSMIYRGTLTLTAAPGRFDSPGDSLTVTVEEGTLKNDLLNFIAQRCEDLAQTMNERERPAIDLRRAAQV